MKTSILIFSLAALPLGSCKKQENTDVQPKPIHILPEKMMDNKTKFIFFRPYIGFTGSGRGGDGC